MCRALIIEKHKAVRSALRNILKSLGISATESETFDVKVDEFDLIISDIKSSNAFDNNSTPMIVLTPFKMNSRDNVHYVSTPFVVDELCDEIRRMTESCLRK